ncbi:outer membrane protein TolC [Marinilabilia salmonicolor]|jgi:outer membrane protein TolC|uniref:TolC family protein n=1 Tax=Marinilabilia salmonicolor TaxID=989 RepID=UPI000D06F3D0|nr:TolC family protein [Marinilabilia salmonicolor]PRZ00303.1 outer membrane protein TolC [Marinilabilia salmonicolor]
MNLTLRILKVSLLFLILSVSTGGKAYAQQVLTLEKALNYARQESPDIKKARLNLEQSRENLIARRASLKSSFRLNLTPIEYSHNRQYNDPLSEWYTTESLNSYGTFSVQQPIAVTDGVLTLSNSLRWQDSQSNSSFSGDPFRGFSNNLSLHLDQPLFTYNRTKMELKELEYALENSQINYALQELNLERTVSQAFYQVYEAQVSVNTAREEFENRSQSVDIIRNKVDAGLVAREELLQAELDLMTSRSGYQNRQVELENVKDQFKQMLGMPLEEEVLVLAEVNVMAVDVDLENAMQRAVENRLEIRQRKIDIEAGQFDIIRTNAQNEFKGNIGVSVGLFGENEELTGVFDRPTDNQNIGFSLEIPLWDWGEKKARMRAAQAAQQIREINMDDEKINISLTIRQVHRSLKNLLTQIDIAQKNLENAKLTYDINLEKYKNGDLTSMDLNLYQNQLTQKKTDLTSARISYLLELLNMKIQTLYDFERGEGIVPDLSKY